MPRRQGQHKPPAQKKPPLTHFLCIPLITSTSKPQLEASIQSFRDDVTSGSPAHSSPPQRQDETSKLESNLAAQVHPKAIRPVGALHLTLGVMSLNKEQLDAAIELLQSIDISALLAKAALDTAKSPSDTKENASQPDQETEKPATLSRPVSPPARPRPEASAPSGPIRIDLRGLVSMHNPQTTSILYTAPTDSSSRLYPFCLALQKLFQEKALLVPDDRQLRLHATLVNTIYAKGRKRPPPKNGTSQPGSASIEDQSGGYDRSQGHGPNANAPLKIDARGILERYEDFAWAEDIVLDRVAICEMGTKKNVDAGGNVVGEEYTEVASVALPL